MTSRERMACAMQIKEPDRVPVMCQLALGHYFLYSGVDPLDIWFKSEGFGEALVRMQKRYQFDGILINLPGREPDYEKLVVKIERKGNEQFVWWKNGNYSVIPDDDNVHYYMADGSRYFPTFDEVKPEELWYVEPWDVTDITYPFTWAFESEQRPFENYFPEYHFDTIKYVKEKVGETISVHSEIFSPFSQLLELLNYEFALVALIDDPVKVHACLERLTAGAIDLGIKQADSGVDAILISSAFSGGGLISRESYQEFVIPYEKRVIEGIQKHKKVPLYTHTCGAIGDRLDLMIETGTNGIDTLDPPPLGTVELEEAKKQTFPKVFIKGNLDPVNTLLFGDEKVVREACINRITIGKPGGGYILSSACSIAPAAKPENVEVLHQVAEEIGYY